MTADGADRARIGQACRCRSDALDAGSLPTGAPHEAELESVVAELTSRNNMLIEASQVKDHVLAMTTHELRTPITTISGFGDLLAAKWYELPDSDRLALVKRIQDNSRRMAKLVEDLLFAITLGAGAVRIDAIDVALRPILDMALAHAGTTRTAMTVKCSPGLHVRADPDRLAQIVANYLSNAAKYGGGAATVEALEADGWVEIRVSDRGPGVPADFVASLFERFSQASRSAARSICGTGLGLAIAKELAQAQGGDTWYEPNQPSGATFAVRMPTAS